MTTTVVELDKLQCERPEWTPWISVMGAALSAIDGTHQNLVLHVDPARGRDAPLLANAILEVDRDAAHRTFDKLMHTAACSESAPLKTLQRISTEGLETLAILEAALNRDRERLAGFAEEAGTDADAFAAVAALAVMPVLHACHRLAEGAEGWTQGYCPLCGGWPAFAEVRGIERSRYGRCGACGSEWETICLKCTFCGTTNHGALATLVPRDDRSGMALEVCNACRGYVKVLTTLRGVAPAVVALRDLATAELDIAAGERGYGRSRIAGRALDLRVAERRTQARFS
jgi:FdhE protein